MEVKPNCANRSKIDLRGLLPRGYGKEIVSRLKGKYSTDQVYRVACGKLVMPVIEKELLKLIDEYQSELQETNEIKANIFKKYGKR
ncbi:MAG: hypothetical protein NZ519_12015 [Bacteroidia bacterium]|nr:hypothetical protein [Bacteroidia bacterium]